MKNRNGFTLLEVIIAFGILSIGFLALFSLALSQVRADKYNRNKTAALQLAQGKLESLKTLSFSDLQGGAESGLTVGNVGTLFQRETVIRKGPSAAEIMVRISWPSVSNPARLHTIELATQVAG